MFCPLLNLWWAGPSLSLRRIRKVPVHIWINICQVAVHLQVILTCCLIKSSCVLGVRWCVVCLIAIWDRVTCVTTPGILCLHEHSKTCCTESQVNLLNIKYCLRTVVRIPSGSLSVQPGSVSLWRIFNVSLALHVLDVLKDLRISINFWKLVSLSWSSAYLGEASSDIFDLEPRDFQSLQTAPFENLSAATWDWLILEGESSKLLYSYSTGTQQSCI